MDEALVIAEDDGPGKRGPVRTCAVTRGKAPPEDLIRFVADPGGAVVPDVAGRLPGRGVWVSNSRAAVEKAVKSNAFARSLRRTAKAGPDLPEEVERLLERHALDALSLAKKAGALVSGHSKVGDALASGGVAALIHGADAAPDGRAKLDRKFDAVNASRGRETRIVDCFTTAQLSLAIGRSNVVHAALIDGGAAERFLTGALRLARYRSAPHDASGPTGGGGQT